MVINMEVIFLKRSDLTVLDYGFVDKEFQILIDSVIPQKSTFTINKRDINASVGDLLIIKKDINYIGIINSFVADKEKYVTKVTTSDFISILDIKVKLTSYSGNISVYLTNLITKAYINSGDSYQNLKYLSIARDYASATGKLTYEADTIDSISSVVATLNKAYSIGITYTLKYDNGVISGIELHIKECTRGMVLKSNFKGITDLVISDSNEQSTNKVIFEPSDENVTYRKTISYYLLSDGKITTDPANSKRITSVSSITKTYKDADYGSLETTAQSEMLSSSLEHSITFNLMMNNKVAVPFVDLNVGDFIEFITPTKTYETMVTQIIFKNNLYQAGITLGEYRVSLTDKLKLLSKK